MSKARNIADLLDANGKVNNADIVDVDASKLTGTVDNARISLDANEIPSLDASKIVSGDISAARLSLATETKPVVSSVSPTIITNDATNITITGTDFTAIPRVDIINTATGIWYSANTVTHNSSTSLTVNLTLAVDAGTYRIRVENPDGLAGLSGANFLTVSDNPVWSTGAGSLGTVDGNTNGAVASVSAGGDTIRYTETTNVLTNSSLANCALNNVTGAITSSDFDGSSTSARTHTFTIRATDAQGQTSDREFTLTSSYLSYPNNLDFLVIAGGGSGAYTANAGGGGAGGYRTSTENSVGAGVVITVTVGDGGASYTGGGAGNSGSASSFSGSGLTTISSAGGGGGGHNVSYAGLAGGSGGGAGPNGNYGAGNTPSTNPVQGYRGGTPVMSGSWGAGGGGGASAHGGDATTSKAGDGGAGRSSSITGSAVTRAGGGGGATDSGSSAGGAGGGGAGATNQANTSGTAGTINTGGGGGGSENAPSGAGGKGVVIISMPDTGYSGTTSGNPTVTTGVSGKTVLTFNASGSYTT